jgi:hypothetical protein
MVASDCKESSQLETDIFGSVNDGGFSFCESYTERSYPIILSLITVADSTVLHHGETLR